MRFWCIPNTLLIQEVGIPMAMVGLLTALKDTNLYDRLNRENRLLEESIGTGAEGVLNLTGVNSGLPLRKSHPPADGNP